MKPTAIFGCFAICGLVACGESESSPAGGGAGMGGVAGAAGDAGSAGQATGGTGGTGTGATGGTGTGGTGGTSETGGTGGIGGASGAGAAGGEGGSGGTPQTGPCGGLVGPHEVLPTPALQGTHFASPTGSGDACSEQQPCSIHKAASDAGPGSVVFLRGGEYPVASNLSFTQKASASEPIIVESYPGEWAILDGAQHDAGTQVYIRVQGAFYHLRRFEVRNMPQQGVYIGGTDNVLDGIVSHHNKLTGIHIYSPYEPLPYGEFGSRNVLRNCVVHNNSGVGLSGPDYADGGNTDGISISSGIGNEVHHCLAYLNSDDGIDTWRSIDTLVTCSIVRESGLGSGDGNGFKSGGIAPSKGTIVRNSISYRNRAVGFDFNSGLEVQFDHVTAVEDGRGFWTGDDTQVTNSVAILDSNTNYGSATMTNNCWQSGGNPEFSSTDPSSPDFMRPVPGSDCDDLGAYGE